MKNTINIINSQINIADKIDKIVHDISSGLSKKDFNEINSALKNIPESVLLAFKKEYEKELEESNSEDDKTSLGIKAKEFFTKYSISVLEHISAIAIVDYFKHFLTKLP
jgi:hypothetical protein